jgi:hypothetical protein
LLSSLPLQSLSAYTMLPPPMPCCRHGRCTIAALPNVLPLPPKSSFRQDATSATKLDATATLPPPRCHHRATTAYKIKEKYIILLTYFFYHDGNGSKQ